MGTVEGNIEVLSQSILGEARAEIDELKQAAQSRADSIRNKAQETAQQERTTILNHANQEARRLGGQATATAQLKARALELEGREQLLERVFRAVAERLPTVPQRKDFDAIVIKLAREALTQLHSSEAELLTDATAHRLLSQGILDELANDTGMRLTLGGPLEGRVGVVARTPDGHLQFDNTLETRLERMRSETRSSVNRVLMEEAE